MEEEDYSDIDDEINDDSDTDVFDDNSITMEDLLNTNSGEELIQYNQMYEHELDKPKRTNKNLTKYEKTLIIGLRSQQLANGAKPLVTVKKNTCDVSYIALLELNERKLPFIVKRKITNNNIEYWRLNDLNY